MSNKIRSYDVALEWDGEVIAAAASYSLEVNGETIDTSTLDSGEWADVEDGLKSWSASVDGMVERGASSSFGKFISSFTSTGSTRTATLALKAKVDGDTYYTGTAILTAISKSGGGAGGQDVETWSASFTGKGALTEAVYTV